MFEDRGHPALSDQRGFTLVELLVVVILLSLLAAIAIPMFLAQREKAHDADAKAAARTAVTAIETWATERDGDYDGADAAALEELEPTLTDSALSLDAATGSSYEISVESQSGNRFVVERLAGGTLRLSCEDEGTGGCPSGGRWD